jgi:hypothetical protein
MRDPTATPKNWRALNSRPTSVLVRELVATHRSIIGHLYESRRLFFVHSNSISSENDDECII